MDDLKIQIDDGLALVDKTSGDEPEKEKEEEETNDDEDA